MKTLRRKRLVDLLSGPRFNGDRAAFLTSSGLSKGRLTQLLNPDEPFGDAAARNLCDSLGLPDGWFDAATATLTAPSPVLVVSDFNQNQALTPVQQALSATNNVASLDIALSELTAHLAQVDVSKRAAVVAVMTALIYDPDDAGMRAALASMLTPSGFAEQHRLAA